MKQNVIMTSLDQDELEQMIINGCQKANTKDPENALLHLGYVAFDLMDRKEALELLKITSTTLWARMKDGSIPYIRLGRRVLFSKSELIKSLTGSDR